MAEIRRRASKMQCFVVISDSMAAFGFIPIITAIPEPDGKSDTVDDGEKATVLFLPC